MSPPDSRPRPQDVEELNFFQRGLPLIVSAWNGHDLQVRDVGVGR